MAIAPIGGVGVSLPPVTGVSKPDGGGFAEALANNLENLQQTQNQADQLAVQAATGDLSQVHDLMIANTKATLATELTVAVRNKAVEAFTEVMRMQI